MPMTSAIVRRTSVSAAPLLSSGSQHPVQGAGPVVDQPTKPRRQSRKRIRPPSSVSAVLRHGDSFYSSVLAVSVVALASVIFLTSLRLLSIDEGIQTSDNNYSMLSELQRPKKPPSRATRQLRSIYLPKRPLIKEEPDREGSTSRGRRHVSPDYGGLNLVPNDGKQREVLVDVHEKNLYLRNALELSVDGGSIPTPVVSDKECQKADWHDERRLNCNTVHELGLSMAKSAVPSTYVSYGYFREMYSLVVPFNNVTETIIFKQYKEKFEVTTNEVDKVRREALVMDRLTSTPEIVNIYAYCQMTILAEYVEKGDIKKRTCPKQKRANVQLNDTLDVQPLNDYTIQQKLQFALEMTKGVAALHSQMIAHDDLKLSQYLMTSDYHLKLNDFNRAHPLLWNPSRREYCSYRNQGRHGDFRSPEEYIGRSREPWINEKIDIYTLGLCFYSLLTGLIPFDEIKDEDEMVKKVKKGETPFIDPRYRERSNIEQELVNVMEECWAFQPKERPRAQDVLSRLQRLMDEQQLQVKDK